MLSHRLNHFFGSSIMEWVYPQRGSRALFVTSQIEPGYHRPDLTQTSGQEHIYMFL